MAAEALKPVTTQSLSALLRKYDLQPQKGLGQNFLADPHHLTKIVDAADLKPDDTVVEVGPGPGTLTRYLVEVAGRVVAVELDPAMVGLLKNEFGHFTNLTIIEANILDVEIDQIIPIQSAAPETDDVPSLPAQPTDVRTCAYKVVANLPYYITAAVLRHLLETPWRPDRLVVTVQKEVAQRIVAGPRKMSLLAVSVQFYGRPTVVHHIPAGAFYPPPKVDSTVICIDTYRQSPITVESTGYFFRVVKAGFSQKRKKIKNALAAGLHRPAAEIVAALSQSHIDPSRRAETLSLEEWGRLVEALPDVI
jgi:16S rRNA (adenine1518-N6/adenine1519-N6)-dimethyltransferase